MQVIILHVHKQIRTHTHRTAIHIPQNTSTQTCTHIYIHIQMFCTCVKLKSIATVIEKKRIIINLISTWDKNTNPKVSPKLNSGIQYRSKSDVEFHPVFWTVVFPTSRFNLGTFPVTNFRRCVLQHLLLVASVRDIHLKFPKQTRLGYFTYQNAHKKGVSVNFVFPIKLSEL